MSAQLCSAGSAGSIELLNTHKDTLASMLSEELLPANEHYSVAVGLCSHLRENILFGATTEHPRDELCFGTFKRNDRSDYPLDRSDRCVAAVYDHLHIYNLCSNLRKLLGYLLHRLCICDIPIAPKTK